LLLEHTYNYGGDENGFVFESIKVTGAKGSVNLEGRQAQMQFEIESDRQYVLRYK
jgi:hypothetical protein